MFLGMCVYVCVFLGMCVYIILCVYLWAYVFMGLEEAMTTPSSFLTWRIPWTEEPGGLQHMGSQSDTTEVT